MGGGAESGVRGRQRSRGGRASFVPSVVLGIAVVALPTGCVLWSDEGVELHPRPTADASYSQALEEATRRKRVVDNFKTRFDISVTYMYPDFWQAFTARYQRLFLDSAAAFAGTTTGKASFFVVAYSPDSELADLGDHNLWSVFLAKSPGAPEDGSRVKPSELRELADDKERWQPFFTNVSAWSREFLLVFDLPAANPRDPKLVKQTPTELVLSSAQAKISFVWP